MSDVLGNVIKLVLFGESHSSIIGATLTGLPSGIKIDHEFIKKELNKRKSHNNLSTSRMEEDDYKIVSGIFNDYTTGTALTVIIENKDINSSSYNEDLIRPGHADYTNKIKYNSFNDYRGGGHSSGRLTAPIVVLGAIVKSYLLSKGIKIGTRIKQIYNIEDDNIVDIEESINSFNDALFPTVSNIKAELMKKEILKAKENLDSLGGVLETFVTGLEVGIGNPYFDSLESTISHAIFSIPGVKGIEFGLGFDFKDKLGSLVKDEFEIKGNKVITKTNNNGGINGGISNSMPLTFKTVIKPTPSIGLKQNSISLKEMKNTQIEIKGRHDPCILVRVVPVIDALTSITLLDAMYTR